MVLSRKLNQLVDVFAEKFVAAFEKGKPEEAEIAADEFYESAVKEYRPYVRLIPLFITKICKDIRPAVVGALRASIDYKKDEVIHSLSVENTELKAKRRKETLDQYVAAGFTREEAMTMLLQDIANAKAIAQNFANNSKVSASKPEPPMFGSARSPYRPRFFGAK